MIYYKLIIISSGPLVKTRMPLIAHAPASIRPEASDNKAYFAATGDCSADIHLPSLNWLRQ